MVFSLPYMGRVIPIRTVGCYKSDGFIIIFGVGLKPHLTYLAGDVDARWTLDRRRDRSTGVNCVEHGPPDRDQDTSGIKTIITAQIFRRCGWWRSVDRAERRRSTRRSRGHGPPISWSRTWFKNRRYNGHDFTRSNASGALDRDPTGAVFDAF